MPLAQHASTSCFRASLRRTTQHWLARLMVALPTPAKWRVQMRGCAFSNVSFT